MNSDNRRAQQRGVDGWSKHTRTVFEGIPNQMVFLFQSLEVSIRSLGLTSAPLLSGLPKEVTSTVFAEV